MAEFDLDLKSIQHARELCRKGNVAANQIKNYSYEQIDRILFAMMEAAEKNAKLLAEMAVEETGFGIVKDKIYKNHMASGLLYEEIKDKQTIGVIEVDEAKQMITVADPVGLIMGIVPSTNPTSTVIFKSLIALKARNAIVFSPHPSAKKCTLKAVEIMNQAAISAGAPENIIQCIEYTTIQATNEVMHAPEVKLIIATGGPAMVKAAYSAGKPAIGVGAGNSPAFIERTADIQKAVTNIMTSKTFDNGTICASEQSIIVESCNREAVIAEFKKQGAYFMTKEETDKVCALLFRNGTAMNPQFVGRSPQVIAKAAGMTIPEGTRVLIGEQEGVGKEWPLSHEKLTTVLAFYTVSDWEEACELSIELLQNGIGHTMSLHTEDKEIARKFTMKPASRILINTGGTMGGTGLSTGLSISLTLGCGTMGGSSVSENVGPEHLINIKRLVYGNIDCNKLVQEDKIYQKYHGNCCQDYNVGCCHNELPLYKETSTSGLSYGLGCNKCASNHQPDPEGALSLADLEKMVNELITAMKGDK